MDKLIVSFDVFTKKASFRQISTNSSSLTYLFPPLPTVQGMLGAILGYGTEYLDILSKQNCLIGVQQLDGPYRTIVEQYSYSKQFDGREKVESITYKDGSTRFFAGKTGLSHTKIQQLIDNGNIDELKKITLNKEMTALVPREWLVPIKKNGRIGYRVFVSHQDESITKELYERVRTNTPYYSVSIGKARSLATMENARIVETSISSNKTVATTMATPIHTIDNYCVGENRENQKSMIRVWLPEVLKVHPETKERVLVSSQDYYLERDGKPYAIQLKEAPPIDSETGEAIVWM